MDEHDEFDGVPDAEGTEMIIKRYIEFIFQMVYGNGPCDSDASAAAAAEKEMRSHYAAFSSILQSSGSGKTRLALAEKLDAEKKHAVLNLHINCHRNSSESNQIFVSHLSGLRSYGDMQCALARLLIVMRDKFLMSEGDYWVLADVVKPRGYSIDSLEGSDMNSIFRGFGEYQNDKFSEWRSQLSFLKSIYLDSNKTVKVLFSIVFDDAERLVESPVSSLHDDVAYCETITDPDAKSYFCHLRRQELNSLIIIKRALHFRKTDFWYCPFMFCSTDARVGELPRHMLNEDSSRPQLVKFEADPIPRHYMPYKPFILDDTWNIYNKDVPLTELRNCLDYVESPGFFTNLASMGRPAWAAVLKKAEMTDGVSKAEAVQSLVEFAKNKLDFPFNVGYFQPGTREEMGAKTAAMAIVGMTAGFLSISSPLYVWNAVRRWMAWVLFQTDLSIGAGFPPEPIPAIAACSHLSMCPRRILEEFCKCTGNSLVMVTNINMLAARLLFLLSFIRCPVPEEYKEHELFKLSLRVVAPRRVCDFLTMLGGPKFVEEIDGAVEQMSNSKNENARRAVAETDMILDGYVFFSHFFIAEEIMEDACENVMNAFGRNTVLQVPGGRCEIDFVIPVIASDGKCLGSLNVKVLNEKYRSPSSSDSELFKYMWDKRVCDPIIPSVNISVNVYPNIGSEPCEPSQQAVSFEYCGPATRKALCIDMKGLASPNFYGLDHDKTGAEFKENEKDRGCSYYGVKEQVALIMESTRPYYDPDNCTSSNTARRKPFDPIADLFSAWKKSKK